MTNVPRAGWIALVGVLAVMAGSLSAAESGLDARIEASIAAGEFASAVRLAREAPTPRQRDASLAAVAAAQAKGGARSASLDSLAAIGDDRVRAEAVTAVARHLIGGQGGGAQADFESLIELITTTIAPTTWDEVGGPGSIAPFPTGVFVDAEGLLQRMIRLEPTGDLAALRAAGEIPKGPASARKSSPLRKVSLPRLEKWIRLRALVGRRPTEAMQVLAGLERIQYVFVYPDSGDLVLAGPAGDWCVDPENRVVNKETGRPVLRLDDLVVVLRHMMSGRDARFGCAITPTQQGLARVQAVVQESQKTAIKPSQRTEWLEKVRGSLGKQQIDVYGLDPRTRAARILVEADYRMKLIGMGLEEGVAGVESYLAMVNTGPGGSPPPMDVLRWWFTLDYDALLATEDRNAFALRGRGVRVLSENELLTQEGKRVHTGSSDALNRRFARSFTEHFEALASKYPVYAEMRNLFDLALVGALIREEDLTGKSGWHGAYLVDPGGYPVELGPAPRSVATVINHRVIHRVHIVAGVSGGVRVDPAPLVRKDRIEVEPHGELKGRRTEHAGGELTTGMWWWD